MKIVEGMKVIGVGRCISDAGEILCVLPKEPISEALEKRGYRVGTPLGGAGEDELSSSSSIY